MKISSHLEYALGEYGAFEYGLESIRMPFSTDFDVLSEGEVEAFTSVQANVITEMEGSTDVGLHISSITNTKYLGEANSDLFLYGQAVREATGYVRGTSTFFGEVGRNLFRSFTSEGTSFVSFEPILGEEFLINGLTKLSLISQVDANVYHTSYGVGKANFPSHTVKQSDYYWDGSTVVDVIGNAHINRTIWLRGISSLDGHASEIRNRDFKALGSGQLEATGASTHNSVYTGRGDSSLAMDSFLVRILGTATNIKGEALTRLLTRYKEMVSADVSIEGSSAFDPAFFIKLMVEGDLRVEGSSLLVGDVLNVIYPPHDFNMLGISGTDLHSGEALLGTFEVEGVGFSLWRRGAHVLLEMDSAYDTVIRPYEERTVRWQ